MNKIDVFPLGHVKNTITETGKAGNQEVESEIMLSENIPGDMYDGIEVFSHIEIDFYYRLNPGPGLLLKKQVANSNFSKDVKNTGAVLFGNAIVKFIRRSGRTITVKGLDALNGTLVIDMKPVMNEILPVDYVNQPDLRKKA